MCRAIELASRRWREVMIYALGLAMSGKKPTMPPKNSSELASDSVLSKMLAASACMVCRGGGVRRGGWKPAQSARLHAHTSRAIESAAASRELAAHSLQNRCRHRQRCFVAALNLMVKNSS